MRFVRGFIMAATIVFLFPELVPAQDASRSVSGGISVPGWVGGVDAGAQKAGQTINDTKLTQEGKTLHVTTGPAAEYWNPANKASGNYTVSATFNEPKYMNLNSHPHPYGIFIAGSGPGDRPGKRVVLRGLRGWKIHRARFWTGTLSNERPWGSQRRCP